MRPLSYSPRPLKSSMREATCGVGSGGGGGRPTPVSSRKTSDETLCKNVAACQLACVIVRTSDNVKQWRGSPNDTFLRFNVCGCEEGSGLH